MINNSHGDLHATPATPSTPPLLRSPLPARHQTPTKFDEPTSDRTALTSLKIKAARSTSDRPDSAMKKVVRPCRCSHNPTDLPEHSDPSHGCRPGLRRWASMTCRRRPSAQIRARARQRRTELPLSCDHLTTEENQWPTSQYPARTLLLHSKTSARCPPAKIL